jgi:hypothetical protein
MSSRMAYVQGKDHDVFQSPSLPWRGSPWMVRWGQGTSNTRLMGPGLCRSDGRREDALEVGPRAKVHGETGDQS